MTRYHHESKRLYVELESHGRDNIAITEVLINGGKQPQQVQLVISYTGQLVSAGIEDNDRAEFVGIDDQEIRPSLSRSSTDLSEIIQRNIRSPDHRLPIHWLYLLSSENIEHIENTYKYFSITKSKNHHDSCQLAGEDLIC